MIVCLCRTTRISRTTAKHYPQITLWPAGRCLSLHGRDCLVAACGWICIYRKRISISTVLAGHRLGVKEVDEGIWLVTLMHYDLGDIDLEQKTLQPLDNPFGPRLSLMS